MSWFQKKPGPEAPKTTPPSKAPKGLKISALLSEDVVFFPPAGQDKNSIIEGLVAAVCRKAGVAQPAPFLAKVQEREAGISTTLDTGLSLPHARMDGIDVILAGMAVLKKPVPDLKQNDLSIRVVFLFFSPNKQEAFPMHLQLLRGVSSLFQPALIDQLAAAPDARAAVELMRKLEA